MNIEMREISMSDAETAGGFIYEAFRGVAERHNLPPEFPSAEAARGFARMWIGHPEIYGVVAEENGRFVGSNFLTENTPIRGVGPITVDPECQSRGLGRKLMEAVIERGRDAAGIRLVQDAVNPVSMSLYASLGFAVKEPLALMTGRPDGEVPADIEVRPMTDEDLDECRALCVAVHGFERTGEVRDALRGFRPHVAVRDGRITAYVTTVSMWHLNHGVAETERDMCALLTGASRLIDEPVAFLLPTRQAGFHQWALRSGLKMIKPTTLMAMGEYHEPRGCFFPSVLY